MREKTENPKYILLQQPLQINTISHICIILRLFMFTRIIPLSIVRMLKIFICTKVRPLRIFFNFNFVISDLFFNVISRLFWHATNEQFYVVWENSCTVTFSRIRGLVIFFCEQHIIARGVLVFVFTGKDYYLKLKMLQKLAVSVTTNIVITMVFAFGIMANTMLAFFVIKE